MYKKKTYNKKRIGKRKFGYYKSNVPKTIS